MQFDFPIDLIIDSKTLKQMIPFSPQYILRVEKQGKFPRRFKIGANKNGWWLSQVRAWQEQKGAERTGISQASDPIREGDDPECIVWSREDRSGLLVHCQAANAAVWVSDHRANRSRIRRQPSILSGSARSSAW
jgi:predicted DNA-binding transcriptional regulator AlpA